MASLTFTLVGVAVIVGLVVLSAFFSSSETALFTLPADWAPAEEGDRRAATLERLRRDPHRLLVTLLVGNNVVNVAIASLSTGLLVQYLPAGSAIPVATVAASFVVLLFGEIVPKTYGLGNAKGWSLTVAGPVSVVERLLYPLVVVFDLLTRGMTTIVGGETDIEKPYLD